MSKKKKKNGNDFDIKNITQLGRNKVGLRMLRETPIIPEFWTQRQEELYKTILDKPLVITSGPTGTGKTFLATLASLMILKDKSLKIKKIYITKPLVEAGEKLGYLPGDITEKVDPFMFSFYMNIQKIIGKGIADIMMKDNTIEILPLAYMRGITLENCVAILDEAQNTSPSQTKMFLSRLGQNAKLMVVGDERQKDTQLQLNGLTDAITRLENFDERIGIVRFSREDIVRHSLVNKILEAYEEE